MIKFRSLLQRASTLLFNKPTTIKIIPKLFTKSTIVFKPQQSLSPLASKLKYSFSVS